MNSTSQIILLSGCDESENHLLGLTAKVTAGAGNNNSFILSFTKNVKVFVLLIYCSFGVPQDAFLGLKLMEDALSELCSLVTK